MLERQIRLSIPIPSELLPLVCDLDVMQGVYKKWGRHQGCKSRIHHKGSWMNEDGTDSVARRPKYMSASLE